MRPISMQTPYYKMTHLPSEIGKPIISELWSLKPSQNQKIKMLGKMVTLPRHQQAYGNDYSFSGQVSKALAIPGQFSGFINWAKENIDERLNGILANWYSADKKHYIGKHRDDARPLVKEAPIVIISLGETRMIRLSEYGNPKNKVEVELVNGSVFIMPFETNQKYTHEVPHFSRYSEKEFH